MLFRFAVGVALVVATAIAGAMVETYTLQLRRRVSQQQYRLDVLHERHARLRSEAQRLGAPARWFDPLNSGSLRLQRPQQPVRPERETAPRVNWEASATRKDQR